MYVITFYSYKGGVGRSMALVNLAAALAEKGKRVLVVDFDLEAPGITTYDEFNIAKSRRGLVDYVCEFVETDISPDVHNYITKCSISSKNLWIMPAGDHTSESYSSKLNSIDWESVYNDHSGFLMFEDLREQWRQYDGKGFDYVLIDSRTGHTDVGGICTRQIPDAVVLMFFPNHQNISGLTPIVNSIRSNRSTSLRNIDLHFCPSNVPDIDDDEGILASMLDESKRILKFQRESSIIHHYNSLDLIKQVIFTIGRPNTKLAKEYSQLLRELTSRNVEDRDGALLALERHQDQVRNEMGESNGIDIDALEKSAERIKRSHPDDPEVNWNLARLFDELSQVDDEIEALTISIEGGYKIERARLLRAMSFLTKNDRPAAIEDLRSILAANRPASFEIVPATEMLRDIDHQWLEVVANSKAIKCVDSDLTCRLATILMANRKGMEISESILEHAINRTENSSDVSELQGRLILAKIGLGRFDDAISILSSSSNDDAEEEIANIFNLALADWGSTGHPPYNHMERVVYLAKECPSDRTGVNFNQCLALACAVMGDFNRASTYLSTAFDFIKTRGRDFSCWSYLELASKEMRADLEDMKVMIDDGSLREPKFFEEV